MRCRRWGLFGAACCHSTTTWTRITSIVEASFGGDAGSSSFQARCRYCRIGAGHWECCALEGMVRGNDELSPCNGAIQTMTCRWQGDFLQQASALCRPASIGGNANWRACARIANHRLRSSPTAENGKLDGRLLRGIPATICPKRPPTHIDSLATCQSRTVSLFYRCTV